MPLALVEGTSLYPVIVKTQPEDRRIKAAIATGDDDGTLEEVEPGQFRYTRGPAVAEKVVLVFSLMDGSEKQELEVVPDKTTPPPA